VVIRISCIVRKRACRGKDSLFDTMVKLTDNLSSRGFPGGPHVLLWTSPYGRKLIWSKKRKKKEEEKES
jgi:hypothetical protein